MAQNTAARVPQDIFRAETGLSKQKRTLVYFIPGNPGYVDFYRTFLKSLSQKLQDAGREDVVIYGANHDGFEFSPASRNAQQNPPYNLNQVIAGKKRNLLHQIAKLRDNNPSRDPIQVILIGHSVGAYILLDLIHTLHSPDKSYSIVAGICLFPTVVDIAKSEKGRALTWFLTLPYISLFVQALATLLRYVPLWLCNWPAHLTPGERSPDHTAVTEALICTPGHVRQLIYLAGDEMLSIREDRWHPANLAERPAEVVETSTSARLFFYWGEDDYWVDNRTRDAYIAARAETGKADAPVMLVDDRGMDHCFSLTREHEEIVAEQVGKWIKQVGKVVPVANGIRRRDV